MRTLNGGTVGRALVSAATGAVFVAVASGAAITGLATPASAGTGSLCLVPSLCSILPVGSGGVLTLPAGLSSVSPSTVTTAAAASPLQLVVTDPRAMIYNTAGGVSVTLTGPSSDASPKTFTGTVGTVSGDSVPTTVDLTSGGVPPEPGTYTVNVGVASSSGLSTLLGLLGLSSLPLDTATLTIGSGMPTPSANLSLSPGGSVPATISTLTGVLFALGDKVSFTTSDGTPVPGLSLTNPSLLASSITGTLTAAADVAPGTYNLVVTDLLGQSGICAACVAVLGDGGTGGGGGGGGGGLTLPAGLSSVAPSAITSAAASNPVDLVVTDPRAAVYNTAGGVSVTLTGPTSDASPKTYTANVGTVTGDSVPAVFNLAPGGVPAAPGTYTVNVGVSSSSGLASLLGLLGLTSLPLDTATLTIAGTPSPSASISVPAGGSIPATISTLTSVLFSLGDTTSFTTANGIPVSGLSLANPDLSAGSWIKGTLTAAPDLARGTYNIVVTDLLGQTGICTGCVTVTADKATALAVKLSSSHLTAGKSASLSGLLSQDQSGMAGETVYLLQKTATSKVTVPAHTTTSSDGKFSFPIKPNQNTVYAVVFGGEVTSVGKNLFSLSNIVGLTVTPKLSLLVHTKKVAHHKHGAKLVATGKVAPAEPGSVVTIYNKGKRFGTAKIANNGSFRLVKKLVKRGHYVLRAKTTAHPALAAAQSSVIRKTVH